MNKYVTTQDNVEQFLQQIRTKIDVFDIVFTPRSKNDQGPLDVEITALERKNTILSLTCKNYMSGPNKDTNDTRRPDYYEFGVIIKGKEVYIKLSHGFENKPVICMSFHIAEYKITYPFKELR